MPTEFPLRRQKAPSRASAYRCPFPDCSGSDSEPEVTCTQFQRLKLCECSRCGRLSSRCVYDDCSGVNRAFARFCVECGRSLTDGDLPVRIDTFWRAGAQPANSLHPNPLAPGEECDPSNATVVAVLDSRMFPARKELISWAVVDGVLLLHQGGGGVAAINAYVNYHQVNVKKVKKADVKAVDVKAVDVKAVDVKAVDVKAVDLKTAEDLKAAEIERDLYEREQLEFVKAPFWTTHERLAIPSPDRWRTKSLPHLNPEFGRPFQPTLTSDHRFAVFSAAYGAAILPLCHLPGWSAQPADGLISIARLGSQPTPTWTLAAAPVPIERTNLDGTTSSAIGMLFCCRGDGAGTAEESTRYYWRVMDLTPEILQQEPMTEAFWGNTADQALPVRGSVCQVFHVGAHEGFSETGVLIATNRGLWVARLKYESRHEPLRFYPVVPENEATEFVGFRLNTDVESRNRFRWDRLLISTSNEPLDEAQLVVWYAHHRDSGESSYNVLSFAWQADATGKVKASMLPVSTRPVAPVGVGGGANKREAYFLTADRGELFSHRIGDQPQFEHRAVITNIDELTGMTICDPLVIAIRKIRTNHSESRGDDVLLIRSLRNSEFPPLTFGPFRLESDPIYWMGGIYFCERLQDRLTIRRIDLSKFIATTTVATSKTRGTL